MRSSAADALPEGEGWLFEPKWDGFRTLVFRDGSEILLQSRDEKPMNRYFPELVEPLATALPERCVLDGEVVIAGSAGLDFEALLLRIHPAESRVKLLASQTPASYVAWDLLAIDDEDLREAPLAERRKRLEKLLARATESVAPVHLSPATRDRALAEDWFRRFEGAGLDGVMAKRLDEPYRAGERTMIKVKHRRTADCVVAGFRWHVKGPGTMEGSLLLGLYDDEGTLYHVGVTAAFTTAVRKQLVTELAPLRERALDAPPFRRRPGIVVDLQWLGRGALGLGHVAEVDPDARPRGRAAAHRVDEDVVHVQSRGGRRVPRLPALQAGQRVGLVRRPGHRDE